MQPRKSSVIFIIVLIGSLILPALSVNAGDSPSLLSSECVSAASTESLISPPVGTARPVSPTQTVVITSELAVNLTPFYHQLRVDQALRARICQPDETFDIKEEQVVVPILLYHFVGRQALEMDGRSITRYNVTASDFQTQLALLHYLGYQTVTISEVVGALTGKTRLPERPIALTVDDGWIEQYTILFPLLQQYGMKATFYIPSAYPVGGRLVSWEQVKEMHEAGMEIGSHTHSHLDLTNMDPKTLWYQLVESKRILEAKLDSSIDSVSYPFGNYTSNVKAMTARAGYRAALALTPSVLHSPYNLYALHRLEVFGTGRLIDFVNRLPWRGAALPLCFEKKIDENHPQ